MIFFFFEGQTFTWSFPLWPFNDIWGGFRPECSLTLKVWWPCIAHHDDSSITGRVFSDRRWHHVSSVLDSLFASIALVWLEANLWLWWNHFVAFQKFAFLPHGGYIRLVSADKLLVYDGSQVRWNRNIKRKRQKNGLIPLTLIRNVTCGWVHQQKVNNGQCKCNQEWNNLTWGSAAYFQCFFFFGPHPSKAVCKGLSAMTILNQCIIQASLRILIYRWFVFESAWWFSHLTGLDWLGDQKYQRISSLIV